ncbi:MAG: type I restriction enzyme HsdR N-terminal domain-containing protein, partial [Synergistaceae bacterium]|nr:type I restriction enzyme HsdR N-terminal domain-containing protein [Synergistaceae bacterium]
MINLNNFENLLIALGFVKSQDKVYSKNLLSVDFNNKKLIYPAGMKGREHNNNFDAPENFVVFECVHRLLEKGYRPEDIELERAWHLGHDAKSGRADICVSDKNGEVLFIIECKTWGNEFSKALNKTKQDGAQLFSYWQQEGS